MVANLAHAARSALDAGWSRGLGGPMARLRGRLDPRGRALAGLPAGEGATRPPGPPSLGRLGALEVRLAATASEVRRAQRLRYRVFYEAGTAAASPLRALSRRDADAYDGPCDHLLVLDHGAVEAGRFGERRAGIVGTCRLLRGEVAAARHGFYAQGEYDLGPVLAAQAGLRLLELGRTCVLESHRGRRAAELLWAGIYGYVLRHRIDALIGCASLPGTDPDRLALPLAFLHHHALAPAGWRARALPGRGVAMDRMPRAGVDARAGLRALPPLLKGYLRLGATVGEGAVVDRAFGTTDVFVALPVAGIAARYRGHFAPAARGGRAGEADAAA